MTDSPLELLSTWLKEAKEKSDLVEPWAVTLTTVDAQGQPWSRVVLIKEVTPEGLIFYTNYSSRKARQLETNQKVCLNFFWTQTGRQIAITGTAEKVDRTTSETYWNSRPKDSQISQLISHQSQALNSYEKLQQLHQKTTEEFKDKQIPCPDNWGGYNIRPSTIEFWIAHPDRLHDRVYYQKNSSQWQAQRLYP